MVEGVNHHLSLGRKRDQETQRRHHCRAAFGMVCAQDRSDEGGHHPLTNIGRGWEVPTLGESDSSLAGSAGRETDPPTTPSSLLGTHKYAPSFERTEYRVYNP